MAAGGKGLLGGGARRGLQGTNVFEAIDTVSGNVRSAKHRFNTGVERSLRRVSLAATRRGLQGSNAWAVVAIVAATVRMLRFLARPKPDVVWRQALQSGDRFEVTIRPRDS